MLCSVCSLIVLFLILLNVFMLSSALCAHYHMYVLLNLVDILCVVLYAHYSICCSVPQVPMMYVALKLGKVRCSDTA